MPSFLSPPESDESIDTTASLDLEDMADTAASPGPEDMDDTVPLEIPSDTERKVQVALTRAEIRKLLEGLRECMEWLQRMAGDAETKGVSGIAGELRVLADLFESPDETVHRYGSKLLETAAVKTGYDLGLFKHLVGSEEPLSVDDLAQRTGADPLLLERLLRYLAAMGACHQTSPETFKRSLITINLEDPAAEAGINHYFLTVSPQYQALPGFLQRTGYRNPEDELRTAFQDAWATDLHGFAWFARHPANLAHFNGFMAARREPELSWLAVYPVREEVERGRGRWGGESGETTGREEEEEEDDDKDKDKERRALYVNIGGGVGHQCAQFRARYPDLPGRVVNQDLPQTVARALETPGVESMAHDFFEPQPVWGAKFYHVRGVLHNHPPHRVLRLLRNTREAMAPGSVLLVDEMALPEERPHVDAAAMDLTMMAAFAGMERTGAQWEAVFREAGLRLERTYVYNQASHESVMDVRLP